MAHRMGQRAHRAGVSVLGGRFTLVFALAVIGAVLPASAVGALTPASSTYTWGHSRLHGSTPALTAITGEVGIDAGSAQSLAIMPSGSVLEFGPGVNGARHPIPVPNLSNVVSTADGGQTFIAVSSPTPITPNVCPASTVWTWSDGNAATEVSTLDGKGVVQVAEAANHRYALTCTGQVYVWGQGPLLGMGKIPDVSSPTLNPTLTALTGGTDSGVLVDAGSDLGGILVNGQAYMWGNNHQGQCGCGSSAGWLYQPTKVVQRVPFSVIDSGGDLGNDGHTLAIDASGQAWCWGANFDGQCGIGTTANITLPTQVAGQTAVAQVAAGGDYSLFLGANGAVSACGSNAKGEVGNGSTSNQLTPVDILSGIAAVSAGAWHALAAS